MEFRQLEAFVNAVKYKSFSKAADATFLTQPTISTHINNLEKELERQLLNRSGREITLTRQGELFYPYAVSILNTRDNALRSMRGEGGELDGVLEIHSSTIPGEYYLPGQMVDFVKQFPRVRFYIEQSDSATVLDDIQACKCELGFTGSRQANGLVYTPVFSDELCMITPNRPPFSDLENGSRIEPELVCREAFILREEGSGTKEEMMNVLVGSETLFRDVKVVARMNNTEAIKEAVSAGLGVSVMSVSAAKQSGNPGGFQWFMLKNVDTRRMFYMVHNANACLSPLAEAFRSQVALSAKVPVNHFGITVK